MEISTPPRQPNQNPVISKFREFIGYKKQIDQLTKYQNDIKAELNDYVQENGEEDDKGHLWVYLPEDVDGYSGMQRQRRVSQSLDMDAAIVILSKKGLAERCIKSIPTVDEDEVMSALYNGDLTEADVDEMFPKKITWAFVPSKS
jgi:hypothetical protein